jgi:hypothetical protein
MTGFRPAIWSLAVGLLALAERGDRRCPSPHRNRETMHTPITAGWYRLAAARTLGRPGLIVSWKLLRAPAADRDDWDVMIMAEYRSMAALDGLREKMEPIATKIGGSPEERQAQATTRTELREILGSKLARELVLRDSVVARSGK